MRNHSFVRPSYRCAALLWFAVATALAFFAPTLHAQCSDDDADSLGCPTQPAPPAQSKESPATLSVTEHPQEQLPSADRSTEASASGSLPAGASYTEGPAGNGSGLHGGLPSQPEPLTEFQRFVAATTGQTLPVYGASLFSTQPASFGPIDHGPAPGELIVGAGDELRLRLWGQVNFSANLRVSREGEIYIPKVGAVHVAGLPFSAVSGHLRSVMERVYRNFELSVDMGELHSIQIYVTGMAHKPGEYTVGALSTLVDAVFASGGPSAAGSMRHVLLKREGKAVTDFDLYALLVKGDKTGDVQLRPGDVLYIPAAGPQVALLGSVRQAGIYELRGEESIEHLLDAAGGRTAIASGAGLSVERVDDHARRRAFQLAADPAGLATLLADGDIVRIDPVLSSYRETVTLRGSVANPGRFRWHEGMRLSELMPDRDSLVKRDYWWQRTLLGLPAPELAPPASKEGGTEKPAAVQNPGAQTNWNYAVIERLAPSSMTTSLIPFNLGKLVLDHDMSQDLDLKPGDVVTIFSQEDIQIPINEQTKYVRLEGEFVHPGVYSVSAGETLRSVVARAGGLTDQAYLYASNFTRKSTQALEQERLNEYADRLEHQLERNTMALVGVASGAGQQAVSINGELIARIRQIHATGRVVLDVHPNSMGENALPDMHLEDGDRFVVPFPPETIQVTGAVSSPHAFLYRRGATIGGCLHLAGGPNREADRGRIFVLRADGSVTSRDTRQSVFASDFDFYKLRLYPGDTVVVPEKNVHPSAMNQFLIWTQFLSQFSLSALEVDLLK
jgi:protein involved in polysaccharide export with SLBB domain